MAKTTAKPKSDKAAKPAAAAPKKTTSPKKATPAKETAAKKAATKPKVASTTKKAAPKKAAAPRATDPAATLAKQCQQVAAKFDKLEDGKYTEIKEKLEWCLGSYNYDKNPAGLADYGKQAVEKLKEARQEKPRQISQKLIDDLEKALAKI